MAHGHRRHVKRSGVPADGVVAWGVLGLVAACGLLVTFGVDWTDAVLGCGGLLVVLLIAYVLERTGRLRPPEREPSPRASQPPPAASSGPPHEPPMP